MKPLEKKQIPQVVAMAILALAFFGYFAAKMILPTPAAAGSRLPAQVSASSPSAKTTAPSAPAPGSVAEAPPPTPGMRDPFVQTVSDKPAPPPAAPAPPAPAKPVQVASLKGAGVAPLAIPSVAPLPSVSVREIKPGTAPFAPLSVPSAPSLPTAPSWSVTGVLQSGAEHVAILRSGTARRFVRQGDSVDGEFVVAAVTRDSVVLRHGKSRFTLPLGGAKAAAPRPAAPAPARLPVLPAPSTDITRSDAAPAHQPMIARAVAPRRRNGICPMVRVADYLSDPATDVLDSAGPRGLLAAGTLAPDFSLSTLDGRELSLSQFRGTAVVLHFWASWDATSRRSLAAVSQLQDEFAGRGLTVLSVDSWDNRDSLTQCAGIGTLQGSLALFDPSVSNASVAVSLYHVPDVPAFYVLDADGRVAAAFVGYGHNTVSNIKATLAKLGVE